MKIPGVRESLSEADTAPRGKCEPQITYTRAVPPPPQPEQFIVRVGEVLRLAEEAAEIVEIADRLQDLIDVARNDRQAFHMKRMLEGLKIEFRAVFEALEKLRWKGIIAAESGWILRK